MSRPRLQFNRRTLVALLVLGVVLPVVFWTAGGTVGDTNPSVNANVTERYRSIDALTGTQTVMIRANGTVVSRDVANVTLVPGTDRKRIRFQNSSKQRYGLQVSNGSMLWLYDTDQNKVTAVNLTGPPTHPQRGAQLQRLVAAAGLTDDAGRPQSIGVSPLPVLPRHTGTSPQVDTNRSYDVEFVKTDTIDGRDVYVLDIIPTTNQGETHYKQRLWVGTERFFPLRKRTAWTADGTREVVTTTYTNVTFNPKVPADTFQLDTDTDASVQRANTPKTEWYRTRATLKERSSISVPNPTVPPGFELVYATRTTGRINGVGLRYADDRRELTVAKFNFTLGIDADERDATVNGRPATLENGPTKSLSWNCNDYGYTIRGTNVESIRMIKVARSVGCTAGNRTNF